MTIIAKDFAAKSQDQALKLATSFGDNEARFGNGTFNLWMLAVSAAPLWNDSDGVIGTTLYTAYAKARNANPRNARPINIDKGNTLANKAAQVNAFANASREFGPAKVYAYCDELIAALKSSETGYDVDDVRKHVAASVKAKALVPVEKIKAEVAAKAAKAEKEAKAKERAKKRGPNFVDAVQTVRATLRSMVDAFEGKHSMMFQNVLKAFENEVNANARTIKAEPKAKGNGAVKAKTQIAPRLAAAIN